MAPMMMAAAHDAMSVAVVVKMLDAVMSRRSWALGALMCWGVSVPMMMRTGAGTPMGEGLMMEMAAVLMTVACAAATAKGEATASASSSRGRWTDTDALANVTPS